MKIIVFDLETTGLPMKNNNGDYYNYEDIKFYDKSRIVSICWNIYNDLGEIISCNYHIIKSMDFDINNNSYATKLNGITKEKSNNGKNIKKILLNFSDDCKNCDILVAHNINFDYNIILSECFGAKKSPLNFLVIKSGLKVFIAQAVFSGAAIVTISMPHLKADIPASITAPI